MVLVSTEQIRDNSKRDEFQLLHTLVSAYRASLNSVISPVVFPSGNSYKYIDVLGDKNFLKGIMDRRINLFSEDIWASQIFYGSLISSYKNLGESLKIGDSYKVITSSIGIVDDLTDIGILVNEQIDKEENVSLEDQFLDYPWCLDEEVVYLGQDYPLSFPFFNHGRNKECFSTYLSEFHGLVEKMDEGNYVFEPREIPELDAGELVNRINTVENILEKYKHLN